MTDNVDAIELRAVAGATYPLVDNTYTADAAAGAIYDLQDTALPWNVSYLDAFPYLDHPRQRLRDQLAVGAGVTMGGHHHHHHMTHAHTLASVRPCSTSAATSVPWWQPSTRRWREPSCSSAPTTSLGRRCTPACGIATTRAQLTAAVFPELAAGTYDMLDGGRRRAHGDVRGGEVTRSTCATETVPPPRVRQKCPT